MAGELDPLQGATDRLHVGLDRPAQASAPGGVVSVQVSADGALEAIHLTDAGRRLDPDTLVAMIVRLHAAAMAESRGVVAAAIAQLENDPRLQATRERYVDALQQPLPQQPLNSQQPFPQYQSASPQSPAPAHHADQNQQPGWGTPPTTTSAASTRREPTPEDDEADDEYFQRSSWLEYD
ncbi:hypothetical protein [Nocardia sp. NPDC058666]|uniref:hypothetical protein n=1 Tax=unclassified Nocardia TaxID=2637762 RepID=UPI00365F3DC5